MKGEVACVQHEGIAPLILDQHNMEVIGEPHAAASLYPGK